MNSFYDDPDVVEGMIAEGRHREIVGGLWEEMGLHQMDMLTAHGMRPEHRLLDIGCGSLRLGRHAIDYLALGNYWGTDLRKQIVDAGYEKEIVANGKGDLLPRAHLVEDAEFTFNGVPSDFDFVLAQSVFSHLPLNHLRLCLARLANHLTTPATFMFTVFEALPGTAPDAPCVQPRGGAVTQPHRDPFHYRPDDIFHAARDLPWTIDYIGEWDHPRNQKLVRATLAR